MEDGAVTKDLGEPALTLKAVENDDMGFLCRLRIQQSIKVMVTKSTAPTTGTITYNQMLNPLHFGIPHTSFLLRKNIEMNDKK